MLLRKLHHAIVWIALAHTAFATPQSVSIPKQPAETLAELRAKAEGGDTKAQAALGVAYLTGRDVPKDDGEAVKWLRKAAERGDPAAQDQLGQCYLSGRGVEVDFKQAAKWWQKAEKAVPHARANLGGLYLNGAGVGRDERKAFRLTSSAAEDGDPIAMFGLGLMYSRGTGVAPDDAAAVRWYTKAGELGEVEAWNNLSFLLATGGAKIRDTQRSVTAALKAVDGTQGKNPHFLGTLARAYCENGQFHDAAAAEKKALALVPNDAVYESLTHDYEAVEKGTKKPQEVFTLEKLGPGVSPPRAVHTPDPRLVPGVPQATVVLWAIIGADGRVRDLRVARSAGKKLDDAALEAARQWKFTPALKDGKQGAVQINIEMDMRTN